MIVISPVWATISAAENNEKFVREGELQEGAGNDPVD
jgi:hypothetical protein